MANILTDIKAPYMETDQWGRRWIDANSKAFWGDKRIGKKETKKSLRDLSLIFVRAG